MTIWKNSSWYWGHVHAETSRRPTVQLQTGRSRKLVCFMRLPRASGLLELSVRGPWHVCPQAKESRLRESISFSRDTQLDPRLDPSSGLSLLANAWK